MVKEIIGYCRYSPKEYGNIYSIEQQEIAIREYASENGCEVVKIFSDTGRSGRKFNRKELNEMLKFISMYKSNTLILVVADVSRLFSKLDENWYSLKKFIKCNGVKFISLVHQMNRYIKK